MLTFLEADLVDKNLFVAAELFPDVGFQISVKLDLDGADVGGADGRHREEPVRPVSDVD